MAGIQRILFSLLIGCAAAGLGWGQLVDRTRESSVPETLQREMNLEKRADIYMARKMYREAGEAYKQAIALEPQSARLYNKLGIAYHQQVQLSTARKHYEKAAKLDNRYSQAINNLGTVHYAQGRHKKATRTYKRALKISPYSASVYSNLGTSYFARGKYKDASKAYLTALQLDPEVFEHRGVNGTLLQERSVADRAKYYFFMAKAHAQAEVYDRALLYIRRAIEEGFNQRKKIAAEKAFEPMLDLPEFQQLIFPDKIVASVTNPAAN